MVIQPPVNMGSFMLVRYHQRRPGTCAGIVLAKTSQLIGRGLISPHLGVLTARAILAN